MAAHRVAVAAQGRATRSVRRNAAAAALLACVTLAPLAVAQAQTGTLRELERYRRILAEENPAELDIARGERLWRERRGPRQASLEGCDLGKGPGVVQGAYAELPRHFSDVDRVMDFESRLVHCMQTLQGFAHDELTRDAFAAEGARSGDIESIAAWAVRQSRGATIAVPQRHAMERAAYQRGEQIFHWRSGPYDYACATCHATDGQRMRLQDLPNLTRPATAQRAFATWPAYRVSQGVTRTMQWRLADCFRQQRLPEMKYGAQAAIDLITFMGVNANGGRMDAPAIKR